MAVDKNYEYKQIAAERTVWLIKPLAVVGLTLWCFHPSTTLPDVIDRSTMLGFLLGASTTILLNFRVLKYYLYTRRHHNQHHRSRVPDEYYFGKVKDVMFDKEK